MQDTENQWVRMIRYGSIALAIIGLCVLSWYLGLGNLLRPIFTRIGAAFASQQKKSEAQLAADVLAGKADPKELVAVMRQDPIKDKLFMKQKGK